MSQYHLSRRAPKEVWHDALPFKGRPGRLARQPSEQFPPFEGICCLCRRSGPLRLVSPKQKGIGQGLM